MHKQKGHGLQWARLMSVVKVANTMVLFCDAHELCLTIQTQYIQVYFRFQPWLEWSFYLVHALTAGADPEGVRWVRTNPSFADPLIRLTGFRLLVPAVY